MRRQVPDQLLAQIKKGLEEIYMSKLRGVYLFGSYARGEQDLESDLDILIILRDFESYSSEVKQTGDLISRLSLEYGLTISRTFVREDDWQAGDSPLLRNVRQEAVPA